MKWKFYKVRTRSFKRDRLPIRGTTWANRLGWCMVTLGVWGIERLIATDTLSAFLYVICAVLVVLGMWIFIQA